MFRYLTHRNTNRWVDILLSLVKAYNSSFHRSIGMAPDDVAVSNERAQRMFPKKPKLVWKYNIGDKVRISKFKHIFEKGYLPSIYDRYPTYPVTYGLEDLGDEDIEGKFYEQEIQLIIKLDDLFTVEKIFKTRKRNDVLESYIRWKEYPDKFNSWSTDVFKL